MHVIWGYKYFVKFLYQTIFVLLYEWTIIFFFKQSFPFCTLLIFTSLILPLFPVISVKTLLNKLILYTIFYPKIIFNIVENIWNKLYCLLLPTFRTRIDSSSGILQAFNCFFSKSFSCVLVQKNPRRSNRSPKKNYHVF